MVTAKVVDGQVQWFNDGVQITAAQARALAGPAATPEANKRALIDKARQALAVNDTYLARSAPTAAQNTAQIRALTRQNNALIRLTVKALDTTTGT